MSKLEELIQQYCPDRVEYKKLDDICFAPFNIKWKNTSEHYEYIDLTSVDIDTHAIVGTTKINSEIAPSRAQQIVKQGDVIFATTRPTQMRVCLIPPKYDGAICSTGYCVLRPDNKKVLSSFLFYILSIEDFKRYLEQKQTMGNYPAISNKLLKEYAIPVPPLPIQEEIVRILDNFAELQAELQAKLQAELQARIQQYNYYRDNLLSFEGRTDVEWKKLGDVASIKTGTKPDLIKTTKTDYEYINAGTTNSGYTNLANSDGDAITTPSRGQGGIGFVGYQKNPFWLGPLCYKIVSLENQLLTKYLYYYLVCHNDVILKLKNTGGVPALNRQDLISIMIPIPPIKIQQHIISILDRFDALFNDISQGLPAEIEARRKQYEYYRDKLLTFKQK